MNQKITKLKLKEMKIMVLIESGASTTNNDLKQAEGNEIKIEGDGNKGIVQTTIKYKD